MKYLPLFLASIPSCVLAALLPQEQEWHQQFALDGWNTMFPSITNIINDTDLKTAYSRGNYQLVIVNQTVEDVSEIVIHCNEIETKVEKINSRSILVVNCGFQKTGDTITWRMSCSINGKTMSTIRNRPSSRDRVLEWVTIWIDSDGIRIAPRGWLTEESLGQLRLPNTKVDAGPVSFLRLRSEIPIQLDELHEIVEKLPLKVLKDIGELNDRQLTREAMRLIAQEGSPQAVLTALACYYELSRRDSWVGLYGLGCFLFSGKECKKDVDAAYLAFCEAAKEYQYASDAECMLGHYCETGIRDGVVDKDQALIHYKYALDASSTDVAAIRFAWLCFTHDRQPDRLMAIDTLIVASARERLAAAILSCIMARYPLGVPIDNED